MIKLNKDSKVYVCCPVNLQTGGTELAHQLVHYLRQISVDAYIVYTSEKEYVFIKDARIPDGFRKYDIEVANEPDDSKFNVLVLPETYFAWIHHFSNIQYVFWWMSVDNYYKKCSLKDIYYWKKDTIFFIKQFLISLKRQYKKEHIANTISLSDLNLENAVHTYQSIYAQNHLITKGLNNVLPLGDYINSDFLSTLSLNTEKENIVLYNPAKGLKFTEKIIRLLPNVKFVALQKLSREELNSFFRKAKLYIDFGNHPGKDRLPREAAINNCCVITGKKGAASFFEDIPIPSQYKFDEKNLTDIVNRILSILDNYDTHITDFSFYKKRILLEEKKFHENIQEIFQI